MVADDGDVEVMPGEDKLARLVSRGMMVKGGDIVGRSPARNPDFI